MSVSGGSGLSGTVVIFFGHDVSRASRNAYRRLRATAGPRFTVRWLLDLAGNPEVPDEFEGEIITYDSRRFDRWGLATFGAKMLPGHCHFPLLRLFMESPKIERLWLVEYDVRFTGKWQMLFDHFESDDADLITFVELMTGLRLDRTLVDALAHFFDVRGLHLLRALVADEAGDLRRVLDDVPDVLAHLHFDEDVAGEAGLGLHALAAIFQRVGHLLGRDQDFSEFVLEVELADALLERTFDLVLVAGVRRDHVPLLAGSRGCSFHAQAPYTRVVRNDQILSKIVT